MSSLSLAIFLAVTAVTPSEQADPPPPPDLPLPPPPPDQPAPAAPDRVTTPSPPQPEPAKPPIVTKEHHVSLTFSPLLLFLPIAEVLTEFRLADKFGLAGVFGLGAPLNLLEFEVGTQFKYYLLGTFDHGMALGAQGLFLYYPVVDAAGFAISPFVAYKIATNIGFTFEAQVGPSFNLYGASATLTGQSAAVNNGSIGLLLNLNVGWSF